MPHITFVAQVVRDIHVAAGLDEAAREVGELWALLVKQGFMSDKKEKVSCDLAVRAVRKSGNVIFELSGGALGPAEHTHLRQTIGLELSLGLRSYDGPRETLEVFKATPETAIENGGNVLNMVLNTVVVGAALAEHCPEFNPTNLILTMASSSDPFHGIDPAKAAMFRERVEIYPLPVEDRLAVLLPRNYHGTAGVLNITSEPALSEEPLRELLRENSSFSRAFRATTTFVSADPLFNLLKTHAVVPYACLINASTAFRTLVAAHAYDTSALLPMNDAEAQEVCKLLLSRAGFELNDTQAPPFHSPLTLAGDGIDQPALDSLNNSLTLFGRYNHPHRDLSGRLALAYPISFGRDGGLTVGVDGGMVACFTSILPPREEQQFFNEYGFECEEILHETGAGDGVATLIAVFNTVSPEALVAPHLLGAEQDRREFKQLAGTIFVAVASRLIGNILVRTNHTNLAGVDVNALARLFNDVAQQAVQQARCVFKRLPEPAFTIIEKWGIRCLVWSPRGGFF
ncbi:MAG: hypothetical protein ABSD56_08870 [Bryobacteraceae bacterium]